MPYSLEYMQIVRQDRKPNTLSRFPATASLIIAGALLLLTPSYALAETAPPSADRSQRRPQMSALQKYRQNRSILLMASCSGHLLMVRHFADRDSAVMRLTSFAFSGFRMASRLHCLLATLIAEGERQCA
jgi:hypothetical protein